MSTPLSRGTAMSATKQQVLQQRRHRQPASTVATTRSSRYSAMPLKLLRDSLIVPTKAVCRAGRLEAMSAMFKKRET